MLFLFQFLPLNLQESVLKQVRIHEALKLLSLTRDLRLYFLKNRPFPQKLDALEITFDDGNVSGYSQSIQMIFTQEEPHRVPSSFCLSNQENQFEAEDFQMVGAYAWPLMATIKSCKSLRVVFKNDGQYLQVPLFPPGFSHHRISTARPNQPNHMPPPGIDPLMLEMQMFGNANHPPYLQSRVMRQTRNAPLMMMRNAPTMMRAVGRQLTNMPIGQAPAGVNLQCPTIYQGPPRKRQRATNPPMHSFSISKFLPQIPMLHSLHLKVRTLDQLQLTIETLNAKVFGHFSTDPPPSWPIHRYLNEKIDQQLADCRSISICGPLELYYEKLSRSTIQKINLHSCEYSTFQMTVLKVLQSKIPSLCPTAQIAITVCGAQIDEFEEIDEMIDSQLGILKISIHSRETQKFLKSLDLSEPIARLRCYKKEMNSKICYFSLKLSHKGMSKSSLEFSALS
ncbi:unnamed protein product, partial [Mesorhabditis belari]|uniref:Uncharacterized protein n=1 Tax=Mesorhabditis belari TaxID=2138241 RepID=A0AAF3ESQ8_9BILA